MSRSCAEKSWISEHFKNRGRPGAALKASCRQVVTRWGACLMLNIILHNTHGEIALLARGCIYWPAQSSRKGGAFKLPSSSQFCEAQPDGARIMLVTVSNHFDRDWMDTEVGLRSRSFLTKFSAPCIARVSARCRSPHPSRVRGSPHPFSKKGAGSRSPYDTNFSQL